MRVTLDLYSGRPNPTWHIDTKRLRQLGSDFETRLGFDPVPSPSHLGFRGLIVTPTSEHEAHQYGLGSHSVRIADPRRRPLDLDLEIRLLDALLDTSPEEPSQDLRKRLRESLKRSASRKKTDRQPPTKGSSPRASQSCTFQLDPYNPGYWNNDAVRRLNNNCYNYAANYASNTFAQPGRQAGAMYTQLTCPNVGTAAQADGLVNLIDCNTTGYLVALVMTPPDAPPDEQDFHWYRQAKEGFWGHKPGSTDVTNLDNSGAIINDPQTADRGIYTEFCGYMVVPLGTVVS